MLEFLIKIFLRKLLKKVNENLTRVRARVFIPFLNSFIYFRGLSNNVVAIICGLYQGHFGNS
ncbi:hypothetical protein CDQ68_08935 [Campylobacter hyointestinalis subsp. hyointestinalis]|nr:hypothetical protein CDQ68_08935 [Campylobacter hyointestinalis subsp. hyointestinalis]PPB66921.1 hypothetical protein CDQ77_08930 [Campylobacter hyointestinalis subsp. hyointestinalis]RAZ22320.1 hypothetical protein CHL9752_09235 [Campylobacter hyointestinalis subsp. lawsonii]